ncbi:DUF421 domain-containing protein [Cohnella pontilimi]|uniref:DUF421 domain-containing protein n=2 Tax=Cohnella pontilimi TaxID=2564100 RepID=A0A4U0F5I8_9BACL|nr:DUF421 domain-containing protein [Cohnella pontilimi]
MRIVGKKTVVEMTGLETITLLAMASVISHAIGQKGLWITVAVLCVFVALLMSIQSLSQKYEPVEKLFIGKATLIIQDGEIIEENLKKLRMSVDQLEAKLREKGISSFTEVKTGTMEISGQIGYELMRHAKPVTIGELEKILSQQNLSQSLNTNEENNLFREVIQHDQS